MYFILCLFSSIPVHLEDIPIQVFFFQTVTKNDLMVVFMKSAPEKLAYYTPLFNLQSISMKLSVILAPSAHYRQIFTIRKSYTVLQKMKVIACADHHSVTAAAINFSINFSISQPMVSGWRA